VIGSRYRSLTAGGPWMLKSCIFVVSQPVFCNLKEEVPISNRKKSGVSGSIRSINMYSCAQCAMQEKSVCCRDVPCLAPMEPGPDPLHPEHLPPSLSAWVLGTQSTSSSQQGWTWTVQWTLCKQLNPEPVALRKCMLTLFFISRPAAYCRLECLPK
jgi:hypothetical protein